MKSYKTIIYLFSPQKDTTAKPYEQANTWVPTQELLSMQSSQLSTSHLFQRFLQLKVKSVPMSMISTNNSPALRTAGCRFGSSSTVVRYQFLNLLVCNSRLQGCCKPRFWKALPVPALSRRAERSTSPSEAVLTLPGFCNKFTVYPH